MGEFFGPEIPEVWQTLILDVIFHCPQHTFQILTKQPQNIPNWEEAEAHWPSNLWLGLSIDGKGEPDQRILEFYESSFPYLRFVSFEPLLGPIEEETLELLDIFNWIIIGSQTGPHAKQPRPEWIKPILAKVVEYDIPLFIKNNLRWEGDRPQEWPEVLA
jgi:protein gp37